jgi:hypothetical protein
MPLSSFFGQLDDELAQGRGDLLGGRLPAGDVVQRLAAIPNGESPNGSPHDLAVDGPTRSWDRELALGLHALHGDIHFPSPCRNQDEQVPVDLLVWPIAYDLGR